MPNKLEQFIQDNQYTTQVKPRLIPETALPGLAEAIINEIPDDVVFNQLVKQLISDN